MLLTCLLALQGYTRFVEVGRVCLVNYGPDHGRLCVIVDVVDGNKALVDGPRAVTGVARQIMPFKRLSLTDLKCNIKVNAGDKEVAQALKVEPASQPDS